MSTFDKVMNWYKKAARKTNLIGVDSHIHIAIGALASVILFLLTGNYIAAIAVPAAIGIGKEILDMKFNIKDMLDYVFGAALILIGTLLI